MSQSLKAAFHVHSIHSDGIYLPSFIVRHAKALDIKILSITDHNEIRGTLSAFRLAKKYDLFYFPGIELMFRIKGRVYELLAYFYDEDSILDFYSEYRFKNGFMPHFNSVSDVINLVRKHNGAIIAPHPYGRKGIYRRNRHSQIKVDAIEIINGFTGDQRNLKAINHKREGETINIASSDMHFFIRDIARTYTEVKGEKITRKKIWDNLLSLSKDLDFIPRGDNFPQHKISIQKPLCGVSYVLSYPKLYLSYRLGKMLKKH